MEHDLRQRMIDIYRAERDYSSRQMCWAFEESAGYQNAAEDPDEYCRPGLRAQRLALAKKYHKQALYYYRRGQGFARMAVLALGYTAKHGIGLGFE